MTQCLKGFRSKSDTWNNVIANQAMQSIWAKNSDQEERNKLYSATIAGLIGVGPNDELEGMLAAQLIACHNASMECYRRAMIGEQTFEGRRENLTQANKLSRTYATLLEALNRHRGKGQQKVTVEHVRVHEARAKAQGRQFGRPSRLDAGQKRKIAERYAAGESMADLAREYEVGEVTIWRAIKAPFAIAA